MIVKIVGVNVVDFFDFVLEIMECIQFVIQEVKELVVCVDVFFVQIDGVDIKSGGLFENYFDDLLKIVLCFFKNGVEIEMQKQNLFIMVLKVVDLVCRVQVKVGQVFFVMQIGDIICQCIEYCQIVFEIVEDIIKVGGVSGVLFEECDVIMGIIMCLVVEFFLEFIVDFYCDFSCVVEMIYSFGGDVVVLMKFYEVMIFVQYFECGNLILVVYEDFVMVWGMVVNIV